MKYHEFVELCLSSGTLGAAAGGKVLGGVIAGIPGGVVGGIAGMAFVPIASAAGAAWATYGHNSAANFAGGAVFGAGAAIAIGGVRGASTTQWLGEGLGLVLGGTVGAIGGAVAAGVGTPFFFTYKAAKQGLRKLYLIPQSRRSNTSPSTQRNIAASVSSTTPLRDSIASSSRTPAVPIIDSSISPNSELQNFIAARVTDAAANRPRINRAFFGRDSFAHTELPNDVQMEFKTWLRNKLGADTYNEVRSLLLSAMAVSEESLDAEDVPNVPVLIDQQLYCHIELVKYSQSYKQLPMNKIFLPHNRRIADLAEIKPHWLSQSLIERLIVRIYEFRTRDLDNEESTAIFAQWRRSETSTNEDRIKEILPEDKELPFVAFISEKAEEILPSKNTTQFLSCISFRIPNIPVYYKNELYDLDELTLEQQKYAKVAFDVQNNIEHIIYLAHGHEQLLPKKAPSLK